MSYPVIATPDDEEFLALPTWSGIAQSIRRRVIIERAVIRKACRDILAAGYWLRVNDGYEWVCKPTTDLELVMGSIMSTDHDFIRVYKDGKTIGWFQCVYGNDGWDVIANNTTNLDDLGLLKGATELADKFAGA